MKKNNKNFPILKTIISALQGMLVGIGAILPGISGGVLCVAFDVYEPIMEFLTSPVKAIKKHYRLFIPFSTGWIIGFMLLAKGVEILFAKSAAIALMLFLGLIGGTLPDLFKVSEKSDSQKSWTPFVLSLTIAYLFFHILETGGGKTLQPSVMSFLLCGFLWGLSLIIPGLSSSSLLIYLGIYEPMTAGIASLDPIVVIPMIVGIAVTALLFARIVNMLFKKHYAVISRIILGFVIASALKTVPSDFGNALTLVISLVCFAVGFAVARAMDIAGNKQNQ